jgi:hypothetical protein
VETRTYRATVRNQTPLDRVNHEENIARLTTMPKTWPASSQLGWLKIMHRLPVQPQRRGGWPYLALTALTQPTQKLRVRDPDLPL